MAKTNYYLGVYEKSMPFELSWFDKLNTIKEIGFDGMDISIDASEERIARLYWNAEEKKELHEALLKTNIPIRTLCLSAHRKYPMGSLNSETYEKSMDIMARAIDFAAEYGIRIIQLAGYDVYYEEENEETKAKFIESLKIASKWAAKKGVLMGFETMDTAFMDTVEKAMEYVSIIKSPYLGVYPDIGNLANAYKLYNTNLKKDIETGGGHIYACHLKETVPGKDRGIPFGTGHTRYIESLRVLKDLGVYLFNGEFWLAKEDYKEDMRIAHDFLRSKLDEVYSD